MEKVGVTSCWDDTEENPKIIELRFVHFSQSLEEWGTWPLTKEWTSLGPPVLTATRQFPVTPEESRMSAL